MITPISTSTIGKIRSRTRVTLLSFESIGFARIRLRTMPSQTRTIRVGIASYPLLIPRKSTYSITKVTHPTRDLVRIPLQ